MFTIAIVNEKGGTGKTTTAVSLSAALGNLGRRVLLVDLDGQAASSRWVGVEEDNRLADALIRGTGLEPIENVLPGVSLAPATGKLDSVSHELRPSQGGRLRKVLRQVSDRYDLTVIDCPPSLGNRLIGNALLAATHVIVPVETSILALDGLKILLTTLEDIREGFGHDLVLGGVLACRYDGRTRLSRLVLEELRRALPGKVFHTVIRENVRMRECPASGESILTFAPECHAAEDYLALGQEMLDHPEVWQQPAEWARDSIEPGAAGAAGPNVDDLRNHAAASVRAAAQGTGRWKPASAPDELAERPDPAEPNEPASKPLPPAPHPAGEQIYASLARLSEAQERLAEEEAPPETTSQAPPDEPPEEPPTEPPTPAAEPMARQGPPVVQDDPSGMTEGPAPSALETFFLDEKTSDEDQNTPGEPSGHGESFPALRALLEEMEHPDDPPSVEAAGCGATSGES